MMQPALAHLIALIFLVSSAFAQLAVNTPVNDSSVVCEPLLLQWSGGTPPYFLSIDPWDTPTPEPPIDFGLIGNTLNYTWYVNVTAGIYRITITDGAGDSIQCAPFQVNNGTDDSCVGKPHTSSSVGPTSASLTGGGSNTTPNLAPTSNGSTSGSTNAPTTHSGFSITAAIVGFTVGGVALIIIVGLLLFFLRRERLRGQIHPLAAEPFMSAAPTSAGVIPRPDIKGWPPAENISGVAQQGSSSGSRAAGASSDVLNTTDGHGGVAHLHQEINTLRQQNEVLRNMPPSYT